MPRLFVLFFVLICGPCLFSRGLQAEVTSQEDLNKLEKARGESAKALGTIPQVESLSVNGEILWTSGQPNAASLKTGDLVTLKGAGFGGGPDIDFSKILLGNTRVLERDLNMYQGTVDFAKRLFFETSTIFDSWPKDLLTWNDTQIQFRVPETASRGPLVIQVQKRIGTNRSLTDPNVNFTLFDPTQERVGSDITHGFDVVSELSSAVISNPVPLTIQNDNYTKAVQLGEQIFWNFDYNIGLTHKLEKMDWEAVFNGRAKDPVTGAKVDPERDFGAIPIKEGEVPKIVTERYYFDPYPSPMPIKPLFRQPLRSGWVTPTGWVGFTYAQSIHPITNLKGHWIGFSCASCHAQRITYEDAPGHTLSKVFPGLPNVNWTLKWAAYGGINGVVGDEQGPDGSTARVDKTLLVEAITKGTGEHTLIRWANDGSIYANDYLFSPIAFPIITRHLPIRRALSHTEMYDGFEGSYIHSEEPDGAIGAMSSSALKAFTAFMSTLDQDDKLLEDLGLYRWLKRSGQLALANNASEGQFVKSGRENYPSLLVKISRGHSIYSAYCISCHASNGGTNSDENMFPISKVGTFFSPTLYERQTQAIRTSMIRNLFWVEPRGLLHDGHVKTIEDLVHPDRCKEGTALYNQYYTIHGGSFKIAKGTPEQELATRRTAYFTDVAWDKDNLYWDYQGMRKNFGVREFKTKAPLSLPVSPHPWCVKDPSEINDLVAYLLTF